MMFIRLIQLVVFLIGVFACKEAMSQTRWLCGSLVVSGLSSASLGCSCRVQVIRALAHALSSHESAIERLSLPNPAVLRMNCHANTASIRTVLQALGSVTPSLQIQLEMTYTLRLSSANAWRLRSSDGKFIPYRLYSDERGQQDWAITHRYKRHSAVLAQSSLLNLSIVPLHADQSAAPDDHLAFGFVQLNQRMPAPGAYRDDVWVEVTYE